MELLEDQVKQRCFSVPSANESTLNQMLSAGILPFLRLPTPGSVPQGPFNNSQIVEWSVDPMMVTQKATPSPENVR